MSGSKNILWHRSTVTRARRESLNSHRSVVIWFTGLSGSGKSTLAHAVEEELYKCGYRTFVMDGDNIRHGLCRDLGFSDNDRKENIRRTAEVSKLLLEAGIIAITALISPFRKDREAARSIVPHGDFLEIYCKASLGICENRDVKGFYSKARNGEITNFTGIASTYEPPVNPDLVVDTELLGVEQSIDLILNLLEVRGLPREANYPHI